MIMQKFIYNLTKPLVAFKYTIYLTLSETTVVQDRSAEAAQKQIFLITILENSK